MKLLRESKLAYRCFRERRMPLAIGLCVFLIFGITFLTENYTATKVYQRRTTYGYHNGVVYDIGNTEEQQILMHKAITDYGTMYLYGNVLDSTGVSVGSIGAVDEAFQQMEQQSFLEGRYPIHNNEIVMEEAMLNALHYPYEIGQEITLEISRNENGSIKKEQGNYQLCGILKTYSTCWETNGYELCGAIIKQSDIEPIQKHLFFYSNYKDDEQMRELDFLLMNKKQKDNCLVYNSYSYPLSIASLSVVMEKGFGIGVVLFLCLLFMIAVQMREWKKQQYGIRVFQLLGAGRKQLKHFLYKNAMMQWGIWYGIGIIFCSAVVLILYIIAKIAHVEIPYTISFRPYLYSGILSFFVVLIGKALFFLMMKKVELVPKGKDLTKYHTVKNPRRREIKQFQQKDFLNIERKRMKRHFGTEIVCCFLSMTVLIVCLNGIGKSYHDYVFYNTVNSDDYEWSASDYDGLTLQQVNQIKNIEHIRDVDYVSQISKIDMIENIYMEYEGVHQDTYAKLINGVSNDEKEINGMKVKIVALPRDSGLWDYYFPEDDMDENEFLHGEKIMMYMPDIMENDRGTYTPVNCCWLVSGNYSGIVYRPNIQNGTLIRIMAGQNSIETECGYVWKEFPNKIMQTGRDFLLPGTILVSENLYKHLFDIENMNYNYVMASGDHQLSYDVSDKKMAMITNNPLIYFTNKRMEKERVRKDFLMDVCFLGGIAAFFCIVSLFLLYRNRLEFLESEQSRIRLFELLGMKDKMAAYLYERSYWITLALFAFCLNVMILVTGLYYNYRSVTDVVYFMDQWKLIAKLGLYQFPWKICIIVQLLYILFIECIIKKVQIK